MKTGLTPWLLLSALCAVVACGDDTTDGTGGGGGGDGGSASTTSTSTSTGTGTTTTGTTTTTTTGGGGSGDGGAGGGGQGFGGSQGTGGFDFGDVIEAPDDAWTFVEFPESRCMNDTPTGIGVNPSSTNTTDLVIFLMGGHACFNTTSCAVTANPNGYDGEDFANDGALGADLFDRQAQDNPIGSWNYVYVPYCTGDVHSGDRASIEVGGKERRFRGYVNMHDYLERIVPTFPGVTRVLLTGVSAGGFGAAFNYDQVKRAFGPEVDVVLLDDSGPPMAEAFVPACLQAAFRATWGLDNTLPADCADCYAGDTFMEEYVSYITTTYADQRFGLISSEEDATIRAFWGYGNDDCADLNAFAPPPYSGALYTEGLIDLRDRVGGENFALFMPPGDRHVWVSDQEGLDTTVGDSPTLLEWVEQLINDDPAWQSWPAP